MVAPTWRIIPLSKSLITTIYKPFKPFGRGPTTRSLGDNNEHLGYYPRYKSWDPILQVYQPLVFGPHLVPTSRASEMADSFDSDSMAAMGMAPASSLEARLCHAAASKSQVSYET